jgi:hypothetical protein
MSGACHTGVACDGGQALRSNWAQADGASKAQTSQDQNILRNPCTRALLGVGAKEMEHNMAAIV